MVKKVLRWFSRLETIPECDWHHSS